MATAPARCDRTIKTHRKPLFSRPQHVVLGAQGRDPFMKNRRGYIHRSGMHIPHPRQHHVPRMPPARHEIQVEAEVILTHSPCTRAQKPKRTEGDYTSPPSRACPCNRLREVTDAPNRGNSRPQKSWTRRLPSLGWWSMRVPPRRVGTHVPDDGGGRPHPGDARDGFLRPASTAEPPLGAAGGHARRGQENPGRRRRHGACSLRRRPRSHPGPAAHSTVAAIADCRTTVVPHPAEQSSAQQRGRQTGGGADGPCVTHSVDDGGALDAGSGAPPRGTALHGRNTGPVGCLSEHPPPTEPDRG